MVHWVHCGRASWKHGNAELHCAGRVGLAWEGMGRKGDASSVTACCSRGDAMGEGRAAGSDEAGAWPFWTEELFSWKLQKPGTLCRLFGEGVTLEIGRWSAGALGRRWRAPAEGNGVSVMAKLCHHVEGNKPSSEQGASWSRGNRPL